MNARKRKNNKLKINILLIITLSGLGAVLVKYSLIENALSIIQTDEPASFATKEASQTSSLSGWESSLLTEIKQYLGDNISNIGLVYYDINEKLKIAINENNVFLAASTSKIQMNMIAYQKIEKGELLLSQGVYYKSSDYEAGTGRLLADFDSSQPIKLSVLLDYSIKYSDNIAKNMIMDLLGGSQTVRTITNSMVGTDTDTSDNWVTPDEEFKVLLNLYENKSDKYYALLLSNLENTIFHDRIDKYIPQSIVAHKIGDYKTYVNDVGIIFTKNPYILVVYTENLAGITGSNAAEVIAGLSKMIYQAQTAKSP